MLWVYLKGLRGHLEIALKSSNSKRGYGVTFVRIPTSPPKIPIPIDPGFPESSEFGVRASGDREKQKTEIDEHKNPDGTRKYFMNRFGPLRRKMASFVADFCLFAFIFPGDSPDNQGLK